jgi:hypothetical protein
VSEAASTARLREPLLAFLGATALASAAFWLGKLWTPLGDNVSAVIAVVFLWTPGFVARRAGRAFDYVEAGLRLDPLGLNLRVLGSVVALTFPVFLASFLVYYGTLCGGSAPGQSLRELLSAGPLCEGWRGAGGMRLALPDRFAALALSQVVVVAIPEELFFRGYLLPSLETVWPSRRRLFGADVGLAHLVAAVLFGLGHVLVDFNPQRMAVFFPALVFAWMRSRTRSIAAGAGYHALCNLFSDVLHRAWLG